MGDPRRLYMIITYMPLKKRSMKILRETTSEMKSIMLLKGMPHHPLVVDRDDGRDRKLQSEM